MASTPSWQMWQKFRDKTQVFPASFVAWCCFVCVLSSSLFFGSVDDAQQRSLDSLTVSIVSIEALQFAREARLLQAAQVSSINASIFPHSAVDTSIFTSIATGMLLFPAALVTAAPPFTDHPGMYLFPPVIVSVSSDYWPFQDTVIEVTRVPLPTRNASNSSTGIAGTTPMATTSAVTASNAVTTSRSNTTQSANSQASSPPSDSSSQISWPVWIGISVAIVFVVAVCLAVCLCTKIPRAIAHRFLTLKASVLPKYVTFDSSAGDFSAEPLAPPSLELEVLPPPFPPSLAAPPPPGAPPAPLQLATRRILPPPLDVPFKRKKRPKTATKQRLCRPEGSPDLPMLCWAADRGGSGEAHRLQAERFLSDALETGLAATLAMAISLAKRRALPEDTVWFAEVVLRRRQAVEELRMRLEAVSGDEALWQLLEGMKIEQIKEFARRAAVETSEQLRNTLLEEMRRTVLTT